MYNGYPIFVLYSVPRTYIYPVPFSMCCLHYTHFYFSRLFYCYLFFSSFFCRLITTCSGSCFISRASSRHISHTCLYYHRFGGSISGEAWRIGPAKHPREPEL